MHPEAMEAITKALSDSEYRFGDGINVLEFGSRNINGSPRELFTSNVNYVGVDIEDGPGVNIVGNAADVTVGPQTLQDFDVVICAEVFEHTPEWKDIIHNGWKHLKIGGMLIVTAASDPRLPHSAVDGHNMEPHEWAPLPVEGCEYYHNIGQDELTHVLTKNFRRVEVWTHPRGDVYGKAIK